MTPLPIRRYGTGATLVLALHGFLGSGRNLSAFARALVERVPDVCVATVTLRGHAGAPPLGPGPTYEALAQDVCAIVARADRVVLVGHSLGGRVALVASARSARRPPVILLDIAPGPVAVTDTENVLQVLLAAPDHAPSRGAMVASLRRVGLSEALAAWLSMNLVRTEDGVAWNIDRARLATLHETETHRDLWPLVQGNEVPILACVRGGASPFVSDPEERRLEARAARITTVPGAGHFLHVEAREATADAVAAILTSPALPRS